MLNSYLFHQVVDATVDSKRAMRWVTFFRACSSRDSFSENIESKAALRFMDVSENIEMLVNHKYGFPKPQIVYP